MTLVEPQLHPQAPPSYDALYSVKDPDSQAIQVSYASIHSYLYVLNYTNETS